MSSEKRSYIMSRVKQRDTGPEMLLRSALHALGYRYRLHRKDLPGRPDLVFPSRKKVVFVHGCFWHGHGCQWGQLPKSKLDYWAPKIEANRERDLRNIRDLEKSGWQCAVVWQCELRELEQAVSKICRFLDGHGLEVGT